MPEGLWRLEKASPARNGALNVIARSEVTKQSFLSAVCIRLRLPRFARNDEKGTRNDERSVLAMTSGGVSRG